MPWHEKAMKDVVSCDKPRVGANNLRPGDFRMGQPRTGNAVRLPAEYIGRVELTRGSETSQYPQEKRSTDIPRVVASERGTAQTVQTYGLQASFVRCCGTLAGGFADPPEEAVSQRSLICS